ncbi:MAG: pyridoxamine 5'-phosphate oxidase [Alphaproteobacteria bacterium]|jgi:3-hydroxyisobutyrate dehydrogenase|nr:pyridoxamine 5'-phosphate oxidase [Alphaproteobacteria bacterium]
MPDSAYAEGAPAQPAFYDNLDATLTEAWNRLEAGVRERHSLFHTPNVAILGGDGTPGIRTVVLRAADRTARQVHFHTDRRSSKLPDLRAHPRIGLHAYDPDTKIQLRLACLTEIDESGHAAEHAWQNSPMMSRACYRAPVGPGMPIASPYDAAVPDPDHPDEGRENFCTVICTVLELEWLYLAAAGHRRARFAWDDGGVLVTATWLAP